MRPVRIQKGVLPQIHRITRAYLRNRLWRALALTGCEPARSTWNEHRREQAATQASSRVTQSSPALPSLSCNS